MEEIWKPIDGYPHYYVSNTGLVKSDFYNKEKILSPRTGVYGYLFVNLYNRNGKMKSVKIHRLVAKAFLPNPNNLPQVNHKNEDKTNNHYLNLEWCTARHNLTYNGLQKRQHDLQKRKIGAFDKDMNLIHYFQSGTEAAEYIVSIGRSKTFRSAVGNICYAAKSKKSKMNYGFLWRYLEPSHRKDG
jgi:hypothetical protein